MSPRLPSLIPLILMALVAAPQASAMPQTRPSVLQQLAALGNNRLLKNVGEAASARQKPAKKRSLHIVNEHFEPAFNAAMATQVVFRQPVQVRQSKASSAAEAAAIAKQRYGGKVLKVEAINSADGVRYRVKLLLNDGRVKTVII